MALANQTRFLLVFVLIKFSGVSEEVVAVFKGVCFYWSGRWRDTVVENMSVGLAEHNYWRLRVGLGGGGNTGAMWFF